MHQLKDHVVLGLADVYQCVKSLILSRSWISVLLNFKIIFHEDSYYILQLFLNIADPPCNSANKLGEGCEIKTYLPVPSYHRFIVFVRLELQSSHVY